MTTTNSLREQIDALSDLVRSVEDDHYPDPLDYVQSLCMIVATSAAALPLAVEQARDAGSSWDKIGRALGMTKQGAQQRYGSEHSTT